MIYSCRLILVLALFITSCKIIRKQEQDLVSAVKSNSRTIVYQSGSLVIEKISDHVFLHTSYLLSSDFGKVDCNGMFVISDNESVIFDTPAGDTGSAELIKYIQQDLKSGIKAIIPTHFHDDCVGGLEAFFKENIQAYASLKTIELLKINNKQFSKSLQSFKDSLRLQVGNLPVLASYHGEGHTKDNIVGYFPKDKILFGGCLIKSDGAGKGNLADANTRDWAATVANIKTSYPSLQYVIPGHGKYGGAGLLDYTIKLFH